jgi:hypothetical protein
MQRNILDLLEARGVDVRDEVRLMRHTSGHHPAMIGQLGTEAFKLYQSVQDHGYKPGSHIVGFYGHRPGHAVLLGVWRVERHVPSDEARVDGLLEGSFENLDSISRFYNHLTELDVLDDLFLRLEIEWTGKELAWKRNLQPGQVYPVTVLDGCPLDLQKLSPVALDRLNITPSARIDDHKFLTVPFYVENDGSKTLFLPTLGTARGYWIGAKGEERCIEDYWTALGEVKAMATPRFRRANTAGNRGIVACRPGDKEDVKCSYIERLIDEVRRG